MTVISMSHYLSAQPGNAIQGQVVDGYYFSPSKTLKCRFPVLAGYNHIDERIWNENEYSIGFYNESIVHGVDFLSFPASMPGAFTNEVVDSMPLLEKLDTAEKSAVKIFTDAMFTHAEAVSETRQFAGDPYRLLILSGDSHTGKGQQMAWLFTFKNGKFLAIQSKVFREGDNMDIDLKHTLDTFQQACDIFS